MLVLSRGPDKKIMVVLPDGRIIEITVVDTRGDNVRLGFTAPDDILIYREEVWERIKREEEEERLRQEAERLKQVTEPAPTFPRPLGDIKGLPTLPPIDKIEGPYKPLG
ncbi:MAG: carbon storage regulator [Patescibacteria group bacterium]